MENKLYKIVITYDNDYINKLLYVSIDSYCILQTIIYEHGTRL